MIILDVLKVETDGLGGFIDIGGAFNSIIYNASELLRKEIENVTSTKPQQVAFLKCFVA